MPIVPQNLAIVNQLIRDYESCYHRPSNSVSLLAVTKLQSLEKIQAAIEDGQINFGENYLQEALEKIAALAEKKIIWHFIGPIQSNKTKKIAEHFDWVQSVSHLQIAKRLNDQRPAHLPKLNICLQVNISQEATKSGVHPDDLLSLALNCANLPRLQLRGLMTIPTPTDDFLQQRAEFKKLRLLFDKIQEAGLIIDTLSMGMSDDLEAAIAEGSTMVRIGTKIFGNRQKT